MTFPRFKVWQDALREPCLSVLLVMQFLFIFFVVPLTSEGTLSRLVVDVFQLALALVSAFVVSGFGATRLTIILGFALTLATSIFTAVDPTRLLHYLGLFLFTSAVSFGVGKAVFSDGKVTHHRVQGAVVIYLNLSLIFATVFSFLYRFSPGSFSQVASQPRLQFGQFLYYSLTTLTTTGYGDIVPLHPLARSMSNLESVLGQIFLATLLARLVNLQLAQRPR